MRPILFPSNETAFTSNGLGRLDPISCTVTEERNGQYELEMLVSIDDRHYSDIEEGRLLLARHDDTPDTQPFEIYYISRPLNGQVMVLAHHISYRTATITVMPFEASSITAALLAMKSNSVGDNPFTITTTKSGATPYAVFQPSTLRSLLAGESGSLLDVYGTGEYEWDRFNIRLHLNRGQDTGVTLRYGKDITELKKTTDISSIWTGVVPFWLGTDEAENEILVTLPERVIYATTASNYAYKMIVPLDLTSSFQTAPTVEQLRATAQTYVDNNAVTGIPTSIDVSFVNLAQTEEYENVSALQRLRLCDTITIQHSKLGVAARAKIIKVVYDVLLERYVTMTVGNVRPDLATTLSAGLKSTVDELKKNSASKSALTSGLAKVSEDVAQIQTSIESEMENVIVGQTEKVLGGSGGYIVLKLDADDKPRELLAMNTANMNTATQVLRINENGIGFSSRGINGPYRSAWTLDGVFVADYIQSGTLTATLIRAGILTDVNGNNYWNLETGEFRLAAGTTIGGETVADIAEAKAGTAETRAKTAAQGYANTAQANALEATTALNNALTQLEIFNRLTNNGAAQGIYLKNGKLYINATYMDTGTLNADLITAGGLSGTKIADGTISTAKIAAAAITAATLAADAVTAAKIAAGAITAEAIAIGAVGETKIADGAITTVKIAAGAITAGMITAGTMSADRVRAGTIAGANGNTLIDLDNNQIVLNGQVSANGYFKINTDGSMECINGRIGGWNITSDRLYSGAGSYLVGLASYLNDATAAAIYAGGGAFTVRHNGSVSASDLSITGGEINLRYGDSLGLSIGKYGDIAIGPVVPNNSTWGVDKFPGNTCPFQVNNGGQVKAGEIQFWNGSSYRYKNGLISSNYEYDDFLEVYSGLMFRSQNGTAQLHISDRGLKVWTNLEVATSMTANQLTVSGSKNRAMDTDDFGKVLLSAYETPTPMFGDVGEGTVAEDGLCYIELDPILAEVINTASYQVFLQKYGPGDVYVSERHPTYFVVTGTPRLSFAWELKGKQVDLDQRRFLSQDVDMADQEIHEPDYTDFSHIDHDYAMEAASYLREIQEDRLAFQ